MSAGNVHAAPGAFWFDENGTMSKSALRGFVVGITIVVLASCGSSAKDTLALTDTEVGSLSQTDGQVTGGAGPIAAAASSSEAALTARRAEAGSTLKAFSVTLTAPADVAGEAKVDLAGAACSGPGTLVEGGSFALAFAKAKNGKVSAFSAKAQGTYEGPGNYSAAFTWTSPAGAKTGTGTMFVYDDEASGEFAIEGDAPVTGTWTCTFKK